MPDRDYYLSADPKLAETRAKYVQHLTNVLTLAGETECRCAGQRDSRSSRRGSPRRTGPGPKAATPSKTYNKMTPRAAPQARAGLRLRRAVHDVGAKVDDVIVAQPSAFTGDCGGDRHDAAPGAQGPAAGPLARCLCRLSAEALRRGAFRLLRDRAERDAAAGAALEARRSTSPSGRWATTSAVSTSREYFPPATKARRRPAGPQHHRGDGPADRQARLDERPRPRRRRMRSSPLSRRRSAIRRSGGT